MSGEQLQFGDSAGVIRLRRAWDAAHRMLASQVNKLTYESYIRTIKPLDIVDGVATLGVPSAFAREWLKKYSSQIRTTLQEQLGQPVEVRYVVVTSSNRSEFSDSVPGSDDPQPHAADLSRRTVKRLESQLFPTIPLDEKCTFDTYVIGKGNRLAHAGAFAVAGALGKVHNPLFIYGTSGLGKTHLLHAIGIHARQADRKINIAFVDGESFTQHYVTALRERRMDDFRRYYRSVDVWLVDDVQSIAGREQTREEFFHTFKALYQSGKAIVLTSDRSPRELRALDERLRSRFESGLIADVSPPDLEVRIAIMQNRCKMEGWEVPDDVIEFIAGAIQSNVRALEGAVNRLVAFSSVMRAPKTVELAQEILGDYFIDRPVAGNGKRDVAIRSLLLAVSEAFEVTPEQIVSERRDKKITLARQAAMYIYRDLSQLSLTQIGAAFGGRDHTTAQRAIAKMEAMIAEDRILERRIHDLKRKLER